MSIIVRNSFDEETRLKDESIFNCASGRLGVRGNFEEGFPDGKDTIRGTYLNGFSNEEDIHYNERLYGFPTHKQTIVNLPDSQTIEIFADNKKINCWDKNASKFTRSLNMDEGVCYRSYTYNTSKGKINLSFERFSSFKRPGIFVIKCSIKSIDYNGLLNINSILNGNVKNYTNSSDPRVASGDGKMLNIISCDNIKSKHIIQKIEAETLNNKRKVNVLVANRISKGSYSFEKREIKLIASSTLSIKKGDSIVLEKYCYYYEPGVKDNGISYIQKALSDGYASLKKEQISFMKEFWASSKVEIDSKDVKQEEVDFCLYELLQAAGKDGKTSVSAKGLSGEGYEGHYFWDCEIYIYPFFLATNSDYAKSLLMYRYSKLEEAKKHARIMGHKKGALYPWRTIEGSECSSYFPSGSAQYHINGDVARAFIQYYNVTKDDKFLPEICEVLLETSRLWIDVGHYKDGKFRIDAVTGPDEYTCIVNNNYYTNAGAAYNLMYAYELINLLKNKKSYKAFVKKTHVTDAELNIFYKAACNMYYPYDKELGIIKQDDSFLDKERIELSSLSKKDFPLLLHYHPLYLYRYQICKQADAVLADYLYGGLNSSDSKRTFDYYEKITTHDSSLSKCIFGIMAARLGDLDKAKEYFIETLNTDLKDDKGNTKDGLHIANMGGCYRMILDGFAGLKLDNNKVSLFPMLPSGVNSYSFIITYKNVQMSFRVSKEGVAAKTINSRKELTIEIYGQKVKINNKSKMFSRRCKAVIFDLDGVVTDTAVYHYEAWKKMADELNIPFDEKKNEKFKGVSRKTCLELLLKWGNKKVSENEFNKLLIKKNDYYKELLNNLTPNSILPGVKEAFAILRKNKIKIALFSVSKNTDMILNKLGLLDAFDVKVTGNDVNNSKPHFEGYLLAADRLCIDPRLCVMVEDSDAGIKGAKDLSLKTIAIMNKNTSNADICIPNTKKLINIDKYL